jgi:DNA polymerase
VSDKERLAEQILGHLKLYDSLGVRWIRIPPAAAKPRSGATPERRSSDPSAAGRAARPESRPAAPARPAVATPAAIQKTIAGFSLFDGASCVEESLDEIRAELNDCRRCKLAPTRKNIVFGSGNPHADLMFVGEAPGSDEDMQGLPFVGRAGQLLTRIIEAMGMRREDVYICNIVKCRPPENRNPEADEIEACRPFLFRQISAVKPKVICALGAIGAQTLLKTNESIGRLRGRLLDLGNVKLVATYHPAYLLRNPIEKRKVWEDVRIVRDYLRSLK